MITYTLADVRTMTSAAYFDRGSDYFRQQRSSIRNFEMVSHDLMVISSMTKGSANYVQSISVMRDEMGVVKLKGRCSCPVGRECKHVVSSALTFMVENNFIAQKRKPQKSELERWMDELESTLQVDEERKSILIYRLSPTQESGKMQLVFYRARLLKKGGYGKQSRIEYHQLINSYNSRDFLMLEDRAILDIFGALESKVNRVAHIEGELGALLLTKMVATGNAYWHGNRNMALVMGETIKTELVWQEKVGESRLSVNLPKHLEVIATQPPYYVDIKSHSIGRLVIPNVKSELLPHILKVPSVKKSELHDFAMDALSLVPTLPLPDSMEMHESTDKPQARFYLLSSSFEGEKRHYVELAFGYGDDLVYGAEEGTPLLRKDGDTLYRIHRDLAYELAANTMMKDFGFTTVVHDKRLFYYPSEDALARWKFLVDEGIKRLEKQGYYVEIERSFMMKFSSVEQLNIKVDEKQNWFDVSMHIEVDNREINLLEVVSELLMQSDDTAKLPDEFSFEIEEDHYVTLASEQFKSIVNTLLSLYKGERVEMLNIKQYEAHMLPKIGKGITYSGKGSKNVSTLKNALESFKGIEEVSLSKGLNATLREYQQEGVNWFGFLEKFGFGGILADDMGLGKTIQTLAFLQHYKEEGKLKLPVLIVAPTSLLSNWKNETKKFTPDLKLHIHHGLKRSKDESNINSYDIIVTTYALLSRDISFLEKLNFSYLILDEAQNIKNHKSKAHAAAKKINASNAVALSGTPMENHLGELWAIFDVVMPNFLDSYKNFKAFYQTPIEKEHDQQRSQVLRERIAPFVLRRTKEKVATELPPKTIMTRSVKFEKEQAKLYESIRISMEKKVRDVIKEKGIGKSHITILDALLKLRQVCCDPRLVPLEEAQQIEQSAKLTMLLELVEELLEEGRRILIFSQFTSMLAIIESELLKRKVSLTKLTGSTTNREKVINTFTSGQADVFLISLKAGGVGLNLTQADTVIHYDPWWNPAAEDQATDRAYRIGQEKPVFVYKLIIENSVEEKILELQQQKKERANALYSDTQDEAASLDAESLLALFS